MFKNHLKIAFRGLLKNKRYFFTNIIGLSVALTVSFLLLIWVHDEYSIDKFHENDDQLFLAKRTVPTQNNELDVYNTISYPFLKAAKEQLPEVEKYAVLGWSFEDNLKVGNIDYRAPGTFANADFFDLFSFPVLLGDITQLDKKPEALAIAESLAKRIWGEDWKQLAIGSSIEITDVGLFAVEAVFKDLPKNSSLKNEFYYSFDKYVGENEGMLRWDNNRMEGVFLLQEGADSNKVSEKLQTLLQANIEGENKEGTFLQKYSDSYLYGKFNEQAQVSGGRIEYIRIFAAAAIFLLIISCINFVNLATVHALKRSSEIGIRKVVGAKKKGLIALFFTETSIITLLAFCLAIIATWITLPSINTLVSKQMEIEWSLPYLWIGAFSVFLFTTILSGAYPAFIISSFNPIRALKGKAQEKKNTVSLRKGLVVLQFGLTILLIISAIVVRQQINFINEKDLGIARDHLVMIHQDKKITEKYDAIRNELIAANSIKDVTRVGPSPLNIMASSSGINWSGKTVEEENIEFSLLWTAHNFPKVFEIPVHKGNYYKEGSADTLNIVVNQQAASIMGLKDPIGKNIEVWGSSMTVIGVLKDFHNRSLYEPIQPAIFFLDPESAGSVYVKLEKGKTKEALASLQTVFTDMVPDTPLHYNFLDQKYAENYKNEMVTGTLAYYFAIISILISCIGLFGLASFIVKQRTKEIGIRKVLGASVASITTLMSKDFLKLVALSILLASPIAYYLMRDWLSTFEYKIDISVAVFIVAGSLALIISIFTVGIQSVRSAIVNPTESLRTE